MKARYWVLGVVFVFLGLMIFSSNGSVGQTAPATNVKGPLIMWDPDPGQQAWLPNSQAQVQMIIDRLQQKISAIPSKGPLTADMISQIADVYGDTGNLTGCDGWTLQGKSEICLYYMKLLDCHRVTDFKIEIKFVYAQEFTGTLKNVKNTTDIVHSLYFILSNSYVKDGLQVRVPGSVGCKHQADCTCVSGGRGGLVSAKDLSLLR